MIPERLRGLCDDAAIFPPGLVPLAQAVRAHRDHARSVYAELVGPLVLSAASLDELPPLVADLVPGELPVSVTVPAPSALADAFDRLAALPAVHLVAIEVALPTGTDAASAVAEIDRTLASERTLAFGRTRASERTMVCERTLSAPQAYLEIPRDDRGPRALETLAGSPHRAKFRTGGTEAHLYPDEGELAEFVVATARLGLAFKATAGLHHAIRNTDRATGFEQHGFLNVLLATEAARRGADAAALREILAERAGGEVAAAVAGLSPERAADARAGFISFGTCSLTDPLTDLLELGLIERGLPRRRDLGSADSSTDGSADGSKEGS